MRLPQTVPPYSTRTFSNYAKASRKRSLNVALISDIRLHGFRATTIDTIIME
jgi:hypothetical protein